MFSFLKKITWNSGRVFPKKFDQKSSHPKTQSHKSHKSIESHGAKHLAPLQNGAPLLPRDEKQGQRGRQHHGGIGEGIGVLEPRRVAIYIYI